MGNNLDSAKGQQFATERRGKNLREAEISGAHTLPLRQDFVSGGFPR